MWSLRRLALVGVVGGGVAACSSSTEPSLPNIVGTWLATKAEFVRVANPATKVDAVALGSTFTLVISANQTFTATEAHPGGGDVTTGTYVETATTLTATTTNESPNTTLTWALSLSGTTLTLTGASTTFDFTGNGTKEAATLNLTLTKQ